MAEPALSDAQYSQLLEFRTSLREFLHWSEEQAQAAGLSPAEHQLLLAIRGHPGPDPPTIGDVARSLLLRHHSVVQLVDRAERRDLVRRVPDPRDGRVVRLRLTPLGRRRLRRLSALHIEEIAKLAPALRFL
jgi:DNA-binding MarR family transcriptional regulator